RLARYCARAPNNPDAIAMTAYVARVAGRWEEALGYARKVQALDPRSVYAAWTLAQTLLVLRRYDEAQVPLDLARTFPPKDLGVLHTRVMLELARGDLSAARRVLAASRKGIDPAALVAFFALSADLGWVLDDSQQRLVLTLSPEPFGGDRSSWAAIVDARPRPARRECAGTCLCGFGEACY
ncbi:MAG: hypothetical protein H0U59_03870, partial [Gemmatimonadaceae bacterium]|nr:hypothetical protein [Gemmatimonadaceae bacterium]